MYGLPQAGIIAQELLEKRLKIAGYSQSKLTPGYWTHTWRPISFTLVVDDFGVKYINKDDVHHLLNVLKKDYICDTDWEGTRYLGLTLDWDYNNGKVHLSMPGYIAKALARFGHENPTKPQHQPHNVRRHRPIRQTDRHIQPALEGRQEVHPTGNWDTPLLWSSRRRDHPRRT